MGSTSRRDDGYSRSLSSSDNTLPSSSRPSDQPQTGQGRPSRSDKPKSRSQNNQLTDVPPRQAPVASQMEGKLSYSDYIKQQLSNERIDTASSGSGAASSGTRESRPAENRTTTVPMAPSNSYQATARRNDRVRRDVEPETWSRGGQVSPRIVVILVFVILTSNAPRSAQVMRTDEVASRSLHPPPSHLVDPLRETLLPISKLQPSSHLFNTLNMKTGGDPPTSNIPVSQDSQVLMQ